MPDVQFAMDYRGELTRENFYPAGMVVFLPDSMAAALVSAGSATYTNIVANPATDWTQVKGISDELANALLYMGLTSKAALLAYARDNTLTAIPGIGARRAADLLQFAREE